MTRHLATLRADEPQTHVCVCLSTHPSSFLSKGARLYLRSLSSREETHHRLVVELHAYLFFKKRRSAWLRVIHCCCCHHLFRCYRTQWIRLAIGVFSDSPDLVERALGSSRNLMMSPPPPPLTVCSSVTSFPSLMTLFSFCCCIES